MPNPFDGFAKKIVFQATMPMSAHYQQIRLTFLCDTHNFPNPAPIAQLDSNRKTQCNQLLLILFQ